MVIKILLNVPWSIGLLCRSKRDDQQGPDMASCSVITSTTFCFEIQDLNISPVPRRITALQMLHTKEFHMHRPRVKHRRSRRRILPHSSSCTEFQTIIWAVLQKSHAEVLLWLPVVSLAANSPTDLSGRRTVS